MSQRSMLLINVVDHVTLITGGKGWHHSHTQSDKLKQMVWYLHQIPTKHSSYKQNYNTETLT